MRSLYAVSPPPLFLTALAPHTAAPAALLAAVYRLRPHGVILIMRIVVVARAQPVRSIAQYCADDYAVDDKGRDVVDGRKERA